jgi:hypothetical protein
LSSEKLSRKLTLPAGVYTPETVPPYIHDMGSGDRPGPNGETAMYIFQMNDGRWHIDRRTSVPFQVAMLELRGGFETREEAEKALATWRAAHPKL